MYSWLPAALEDGAEVVTATNRLARDLRNAHDARMAASGRQVWRTPRILPFTAWLRTLVRQAAPAARVPQLLEAPASAVLWEQALRAAAGERVLHATGIVRQMQHTWQRLQDWCVPTVDLDASAASEDQRLFAVVARAYEAELRANEWMDTAQLAACAGALAGDRLIRIPGLVLQVGFDRLPPAARRLFDLLERHGSEVRAVPAARRQRLLQKAAAPDADAELRSAGAWAARQLAANPSVRVAIVRVALEADAERCARLVREGFVPGWQYGERSRQAAVDVSYGRRLSEYPLIAVALLWLKWAQRELDTREIGILLRSPFIGSASVDDRHRMDALLRRMPDRPWSPQALADGLLSAAQGSVPGTWLALLEEVTLLVREAGRSASPSAWAERIDAFLLRLGWPGDRVPDSAEFQLGNRWRELLNELSLLEPVRPRLRLSEAVSRLAALATETLFQPESPEGALQLLGPLEAAGLELDAVWFANLEATQWPAPAWPLPLISRSLQRKVGMPDADPADTLEHAQRILARVAGSATSVVLSWPQADREAALIPSPLLDGWPGPPAPGAADPGWFAAGLGGDALWRETHDPVPALAPGERVRGGAYTVQAWFGEPFAAFAVGRLGIRALPAIEIGLSAGLRGTIVHQALRVLLAERPSRADMQGWSAAERARRIADAIEAALLSPSRHADAVLGRLLALERDRVRRLMERFIEAEIERPDFTVIGVECERELRRHGVTLDLRIDRLDRLDNGSVLVVDYKTGLLKTLLSADGVPAEWQTVVYAATLDERIGGLVLINLDSRGIAYRGSGDSIPWNRLAPDEWTARLGQWSRAVDEALVCMASGDVRLDLRLSVEASRPLNVLSRAEVLKRDG